MVVMYSKGTAQREKTTRTHKKYTNGGEYTRYWWLSRKKEKKDCAAFLSLA